MVLIVTSAVRSGLSWRPKWSCMLVALDPINLVSYGSVGVDRASASPLTIILLLRVSLRLYHNEAINYPNENQTIFYNVYICGVFQIKAAGSFFVCCLAHRGSTVGFLLLQCSSGVVRHPGDLRVSVATRSCRVLIFASSWYLSVIYLFPVMIH